MGGAFEGKRARILLVEDDLGDQELVRRAFDGRECLADVEIARDGSEALDRLLHRGPFADPEAWPLPGLILLDLNLPGVPGKQVLEEIRKHGALRRTPVVVVSTSARRDDICDSYELGCNAYLIKPLEASRFIAMLQQNHRYWFEVVALPGD